MPITFGLHVTEEFVFPGCFIGWDNVFRPKYTATPGSYYVKANAIPGVASLLVGLGAFDYAGKYSLSGIRSWLRGAIRTRR